MLHNERLFHTEAASRCVYGDCVWKPIFGFSYALNEAMSKPNEHTKRVCQNQMTHPLCTFVALWCLTPSSKPGYKFASSLVATSKASLIWLQMFSLPSIAQKPDFSSTAYTFGLTPDRMIWMFSFFDISHRMVRL